MNAVQQMTNITAHLFMAKIFTNLQSTATTEVECSFGVRMQHAWNQQQQQHQRLNRRGSFVSTQIVLHSWCNIYKVYEMRPATFTAIECVSVVNDSKLGKPIHSRMHRRSKWKHWAAFKWVLTSIWLRTDQVKQPTRHWQCVLGTPNHLLCTTKHILLHIRTQIHTHAHTCSQTTDNNSSSIRTVAETNSTHMYEWNSRRLWLVWASEKWYTKEVNIAVPS